MNSQNDINRQIQHTQLIYRKQSTPYRKYLLPPRAQLLPKEQQFFPVIAQRKLNPIKTKQILLHKQKQKKRQLYHLSRLVRQNHKLLHPDKISNQNSINSLKKQKYYTIDRSDDPKRTYFSSTMKMNNYSFINLRERVKQNSRYVSLSDK